MRYIKAYLYILLLLVAVAAFAEEVSGAHEQFANQIKNIVESFLKRSDEHKKEMYVYLQVFHHLTGLSVVK